MSNETQGSGPSVAATNENDGVRPEGLDAEAQGAESAPANSGEQRSASDHDPVQKKFNKLTYERRRLERENQQLRQQIQSNSGGNRLDPKRDGNEEADAVGRFKSLADFEYDEQRYQEYLFGEVSSRVETKLEKKFSERETQQQQRQRFSKFSQNEREFAKKTPDYFEVTRDPLLDGFTPIVKDLLATSDIGPDLAYHLAKNPDALFEIADMDERSAARAIGRLEERIQAARKAPAGRTVSRAPAPAPKLDATDEALEKEDGEMSDAEWLARRRKEVSSRGL